MRQKRSWVKAEAIRLRIEERLSVREIAKRLDSFQGTVSRWVKDYPLTSAELASRRKEGCKKSGKTRVSQRTKLLPSGELLRKCSRCEIFKLDNTFPKKPNGHALGLCFECRLSDKKAHYIANKDGYKKRARLRIKEIRQRVSALKDGPCTDCGKKFPPCAMEFDHLDQKKKTKNVSALVSDGSWEKILLEIKKCELVCAICHAIRTHMGRTSVRKGLQNPS